MASDGLFIYIPEGVNMNRPVQVVNLVQADNDTFQSAKESYYRGEKFKVLHNNCDHTLAPQKFLTMMFTEVFVGENAHFRYYQRQNEHNNACKIQIILFIRRKQRNLFK